MRTATVYTLDGDDLKAAIRAFVRDIENGSPGPVGTVRKITLKRENDELPDGHWGDLFAVVEVSDD